MLVATDGDNRWPTPMFSPPPPPPKKAIVEVDTHAHPHTHTATHILIDIHAQSARTNTHPHNPHQHQDEVVVQDPMTPFTEGATLATAAAGALIVSGMISQDAQTYSLLTAFALSSYAGYKVCVCVCAHIPAVYTCYRPTHPHTPTHNKVVTGVAPALHSPLMAETNAISGMTAGT